MVTYYEVKSFIHKILCGKYMDEDNDEDIVVDLRRYHRDPVLQGAESNEQIIITNTELQDLYNTVCSMNTNGLQLYTGRSFEIAIDVGSFIARRQEIPMVSEDTVNGIRYELSVPSVEYSMYLLMMIRGVMNQKEGPSSRIPPVRLRRSLDIRTSHNDELSLTTILPHIVGELTLKITNTGDGAKCYESFCSYKNSFVFNFMYKTGVSLIEFAEISDIFPLNNFRGRRDTVQIDTPPLRKYAEDVIDYYKQALASNDPYIKYISFYHVMEYFFDEVFKQKMVRDLKNKITHPDFSYKNDEKIYEIAMFVKNRLRMNDETGQGNELESLKYVLNEYVPIDDLKTRIQAIDSNAIQYYQSNKATFCNAPVIGWSDLQGIYNQLARRIYITRNSLVHSKSGKNKERYRPYKDEKHLELEIPLVKAVAELIIINSSEII